MKFTDGYWQTRPGIVLHHAVELHDVVCEDAALTLYAATRPIRHRGDTVNTPIITVHLSSPVENVIRVQICHHKGRRIPHPRFQIHSHSNPKVEIQDDSLSVSLTSGQLTARVEKFGNWRIDFLAGSQLVTRSADRAIAFADAPEGRYMLEQLSLGVGECVYGLGERFTAFVKNGQVVDLWNEDGGTSSEQAYKNIPFFLTNRGYGVFINHPERVSLEVASEKVERIQFSVPGENLEYFLIYGPSPKEVLSRYTALTGRPALPPAWSFGLWLTTSFTTSYDEETVNGFIQGMADRDLPLHVFHFDCFWMKEFQWVDFSWDRRVFPDPPAMLRRLKERGLRICVWINPYIAQRSALFDEGKEGGFLVKRRDGDVWQWDNWQAGMALVDFTNPAACRWFASKLAALVDMGVDCFKTDFGERIPTDVVYHDGSDPLKMHNYYTFLYNQTVFNLLEDRLGKGNAVVFARSATAGGQQFPVHWGGDSTASFESMAESLRGGLSLGLSGFGFWSHDIGGFEQTAPASVYKRWCAFGLLSSHSRLHGSSSYRVPWLFDEEAVDVLRFFTRLKCQLMPYLFSSALEAHNNGIPMMRAMMLEFPNDPACDSLDRQYMLGPSLLVAPVFTEEGEVNYYLPEGRWTHFLTGQVIEGGRWQREKHSYLSLPLMARPNSVIAVGNDTSRSDYDYANGVILHVFELADNYRLQVQVTTPVGKPSLTVDIQRRGSQIKIQAQSRGKPWSALLRNILNIRTIEGGKAVSQASGTQLTPAEGSLEMVVEL